MQALEGCQNELNTYCADVTPGNERIVACIKAYEDKLSEQCVYAISRASFLLEALASTLRYIVVQCEADALKHCGDVPLGDQRVLQCLADKRAELSGYCATALSDIGK